MPKQDGHNPLGGTVDNLTYYRSKDGYKVRKRGMLEKGRVFTDPKFKRTRENMSEFSEAAKQNKLIRTAFSPLLKNIADKLVMRRLSTGLFKVIRSDFGNLRGSRTVVGGNLAELNGFEFNGVNPLLQSFGAPFSYSIDRVTGKCMIHIPSFNPGESIRSSAEATHYRIVAAAAEVDFSNGTFALARYNGNAQALQELPTVALDIEIDVQPNSTLPIFMVMGIEFYQNNGGNLSLLQNGAFNALKLLDVNTQ